MRYMVVFGSRTNHVVIGQANSLLAAQRLRKVSGDIVIDMETGEPAKTEYWLWPAEKEIDCYARRRARTGIWRQPGEPE